MVELKQILKSQTPAQWIEHGIVALVGISLLKKLWNQGIGATAIKALQSTSVGRAILEKEMDKQVQEAIDAQFPKTKSKVPRFSTIPEDGYSHEKVMEYLTQMKIDQKDLPSHDEKLFSLVYDAGEKHSDFTTEVSKLFIKTNLLNPMAFKSLRNMENEVVRMAINMLHGDEKASGTFSSGGTESLLLMVKTYRDRARVLHPHILEPEMIMPITGHPGMVKGCHYFGVKLVTVPIDEETKRVDIDAVKKAINNNTILLVGSAPQYPHGVIDDIEALSKLALENDLPLHVDSCIGGFILPWIEALGHDVRPFDFRVPGVTSISADVHKYGYCDKGASVILYRNAEIRKFQYHVTTNWPGGFYLSPTLMGTRCGSPVASAWASLVALGQKGFLELTKQVIECRSYLVASIQSIPEVELMAFPDSTLLSFRASPQSKLNSHAIADVMEDKFGWHIDRQRLPDCLHMTLMPRHNECKERFIDNLKSSISIVKSDPKKYNSSGTAAMYGNVATIPKGTDVIDSFLLTFMDRTYHFK